MNINPANQAIYCHHKTGHIFMYFCIRLPAFCFKTTKQQDAMHKVRGYTMFRSRRYLRIMNLHLATDWIHSRHDIDLFAVCHSLITRMQLTPAIVRNDTIHLASMKTHSFHASSTMILCIDSYPPSLPFFTIVGCTRNLTQILLSLATTRAATTFQIQLPPDKSWLALAIDKIIVYPSVTSIPIAMVGDDNSKYPTNLGLHQFPQVVLGSVTDGKSFVLPGWIQCLRLPQ